MSGKAEITGKKYMVSIPSTTLNKIRVLLVDDHAVVRAGYQMLLQNTDDIEVVSES